MYILMIWIFWGIFLIAEYPYQDSLTYNKSNLMIWLCQMEHFSDLLL